MNYQYFGLFLNELVLTYSFKLRNNNQKEKTLVLKFIQLLIVRITRICS